jgi:hypothetical protein
MDCILPSFGDWATLVSDAMREDQSHSSFGLNHASQSGKISLATVKRIVQVNHQGVHASRVRRRRIPRVAMDAKVIADIVSQKDYPFFGNSQQRHPTNRCW